jgi:class 3 adenylate cyclase
MTLDGVMEAPGFEEHRTGRNGWAMQVGDEELQAWNAEQIFGAAALLFGRTTWNIWLAFWPDPPEVARTLGDHITGLPKYVVSKTLRSVDWANSMILRGDLRDEVTAIKGQPGGDLVVYGSADLVNGLLDVDLVDELRLVVFPVLLGSGKRLFRDESSRHELRLVSSRQLPSGAVILTYARAAAAPVDPAADAYRWTDEHVRSFRAAEDADRVLATVLFTDIVDSTRRAAELGDGRWTALLEEHFGMARRAIDRFGGREIKTTGDGLVATFDGPARAIRAAASIRDGVRELGLEIRAGLHTGEIEIQGSDIAGLAVHIAARILGLASPGEVVLSGTVRDLVVGSGFSFEDRGTHELKGVPGEWRAFVLADG